MVSKKNVVKKTLQKLYNFLLIIIDVSILFLPQWVKILNEILV